LEKKIRVAIILDNPKRDAAANTLLANEFAKRDYQVFLVPLYIQTRELLAIRPHITILNYHRKGSDWLVDFLLRLRSKVFILETEGAVFVDFEKTKELYSTDNELKSKIDGYFIWGKAIYENFVKHAIYPKEKLLLTGSPRTDLLADKYKVAVAEILETELQEQEQKIFKTGYFLINTNNALINGILSNEEETRQHLQKTFGYDSAYVDELLKEQHERLEALIFTAKSLAIRFPKENFVIRPHPFEKVDTYHSQLNEFGNILVSNTGSIDGWLTNCKAVVMKSCSTSLEAVIANVPVFNIGWLQHKHVVPETEQISFSAACIDELTKQLEMVIAGIYRADTTVEQKRNDIICNLYYSDDGTNHQRIVSLIESSIQNSRLDELSDKEVDRLRTLSFGISNTIKKSLGINPFLSLKTFKLKDPNINWTKGNMYFNEIYIDSILKAFNSEKRAIINPDQFGSKYPFSRSVEIT
jgi:surface carbohydrate biosynthesis protein